MNLFNYSAVLFVNNIEISKSFYSGLLGLTIETDLGKNVIYKGGLTIWEINENHIIPRKIGLKNTSERSSNRFEIYFETENIEVVFDNLKNSGIRFLHELHEEPWGQYTFRFFDPDNHLIEIGEPMISFVIRMHRQGLSTEQISLKTSLPVEEVLRMIS